LNTQKSINATRIIEFYLISFLKHQKAISKLFFSINPTSIEKKQQPSNARGKKVIGNLLKSG
jgi:hypothetical protein